MRLIRRIFRLLCQITTKGFRYQKLSDLNDAENGRHLPNHKKDHVLRDFCYVLIKIILVMAFISIVIANFRRTAIKQTYTTSDDSNDDQELAQSKRSHLFYFNLAFVFMLFAVLLCICLAPKSNSPEELREKFDLLCRENFSLNVDDTSAEDDSDTF